MPFIEQGTYFPNRCLYKNLEQPPVRSFNRALPKPGLRGDQLPVIALRVSKELPEMLGPLLVLDDTFGLIKDLGRRHVKIVDQEPGGGEAGSSGVSFRQHARKAGRPRGRAAERGARSGDRRNPPWSGHPSLRPSQDAT
jgi:hypothetical protein